MKKLSEVQIGQKAEIADFLDTSIKCFSSRFGIEIGQVVTCIAKPGPIVIQKNHQEIAIGSNLCNQINVKLV